MAAHSFSVNSMLDIFTSFPAGFLEFCWRGEHASHEADFFRKRKRSEALPIVNPPLRVRVAVYGLDLHFVVVAKVCKFLRPTISNPHLGQFRVSVFALDDVRQLSAYLIRPIDLFFRALKFDVHNSSPITYRRLDCRFDVLHYIQMRV